MRTRSDDIPVVMDAPGATARHRPDFGTVAATLAAEHYRLEAGVDISPLLEGLPDDGCQAPHWGYVISGRVTVTYTGGEQEACRAGDLVHWPAGHTVRADEDTEMVLFSPQVDHQEVMAHMAGRLATLTG
ncbi:MAG: cupin domain-containing protein [Acidimicrobiia bacterium]|nr:cupin domain-containing protein [Acidimicrobiia bacterium]